jgi:hypothetical protein
VNEIVMERSRLVKEYRASAEQFLGEAEAFWVDGEKDRCLWSCFRSAINAVQAIVFSIKDGNAGIFRELELDDAELSVKSLRGLPVDVMDVIDCRFFTRIFFHVKEMETSEGVVGWSPEVVESDMLATKRIVGNMSQYLDRIAGVPGEMAIF